ncbi:NifB/NifX family molybdenum-iron cluster-binding protein [Clostridium gelidum]|nr:NifB/NifX family molybdenum-iron cluster-binding protein [Clostridium gelidum]
MEDFSITAIKNDNLFQSSSGEKLGNEVLKHDCEALITGKIKPLAFNILADACVTRYFGIGNSVQNTIELMKNRSLKLIRNYDGTEKCDGHHN